MSAIGDIPLKQYLAATGSINQLGEIQAIGGVNEKIEGYFDICLKRGLSGEQGVIIPAANRVHLMLRQDVREAVKAGMFNVYTADHVEDVMELLSGLPRGERDKENRFAHDSFNGIVQNRIERLQKLYRQYAHPDKEQEENPAEER